MQLSTPVAFCQCSYGVFLGPHSEFVSEMLCNCTLAVCDSIYSLLACSADEILVRMPGSQVTQHYLETEGFHFPIVVPDMEGLGLKLPPLSFSVRDVEQYVGKACVCESICLCPSEVTLISDCNCVTGLFYPARL